MFNTFIYKEYLMNIHNKYTITLLLACLASTLSASNSPQQRHNTFRSPLQIFDAMEENMRFMRQMFQEEEGGINFNIEETDGGVLITAKGLDTDTFDATISDDATNLHIKTNQGIIKLNTDGPYVELSWQQQKEQKETKEGKEKVVFVSSSQQSIGRMLGKSLNLETENLKINYDQSSKMLSVEIPYEKTRENRKQIPVTIKNKK